MDLSETALKALKYDKTKITITFMPIVVSGRITFKMLDSVNRNYAFKDCGPSVIPCLIVKHEVSKSTFANMFMYEQTSIAGDYGTYRTVPKVIRKEFLNSFSLIAGKYPIFEGYFDNLYIANRAYTEFVIPTMLNKIMPFERITDKTLIDTIKAKDFTDYGFDDAIDDFNDINNLDDCDFDDNLEDEDFDNNDSFDDVEDNGD